MAAKLSGPSGGSRYSLGQSAEMNVTPMVDVMLVLLIIFMVAAPLATVSIKLDLPPASPPTNAHPKPPTVISVQQSGDLYIGTQKTSLGSLAGDVGRALGGPNPQLETVYIRADLEVKYSAFMAVLNDLQDGGFYKISLITEDRVAG